MKRLFALLLALCMIPMAALADDVYATVEDAAAYVISCREAGMTEFELTLSKDAYNAIKDDLEGFYATVGIRTADVRTLSVKSRITFSNVVYGESVVVLDTVLGAMEYVKNHLGQSTIEVYLTRDMYKYFMKGVSGLNFIPDPIMPAAALTLTNGIFDYSFLYRDDKQMIILEVKKLYPGVEILLALENGTEAELSPRLSETLQAARDVAALCMRETPIETACAIHDWLCEKNVYDNVDGTDEDDTAIGAILNGVANCDGYSDAFLLIGTLAGLEVRSQHGDSQPGFMESMFDTSSHMWNMIKLDGTWRMVDVTWDDQDPICYTWFNIGEDRAALTHKWRSETTVEMDPVTDLTLRPDNEYLVSNPEEVAAAVKSAQDKGQDVFYLFHTASDEAYSECLNAAYTIGNCRYGWNNKLNMMTIFLK